MESIVCAHAFLFGVPRGSRNSQPDIRVCSVGKKVIFDGAILIRAILTETVDSFLFLRKINCK